MRWRLLVLLPLLALAFLPACDLGAPAASPTPVVRVLSPTAPSTPVPTGTPTTAPTKTPTVRPNPTATLTLPASRIAFQKQANPIRGAEEAPPSHIYVIWADHSRPPIRLAEGQYPRWSPDGTRIAFERVQGGNRDLWVINADGTEEKRLTQDPQCDIGAEWAPDGQGLVFERGQCNARYRSFGPLNKDIYYVRADGSGLVNLTRTPQFSESTPHWSPDGQHIAYGAWDFEHLENGDQTYIMNADGSQPFVVFQCTKHCSPMGWSPDGQRLLLAAEGAVLVITLDGSVVANIPHVGGGVWSPDGQYIAVVANCPDQINSTNVCTYITNADGSGLRLLTTEPGTGLSWSPDGRWLLFSSEGLWLVRADGSQLIPLIGQDDRLYQYYAPEWAPK